MFRRASKDFLQSQSDSDLLGGDRLGEVLPGILLGKALLYLVRHGLRGLLANVVPERLLVDPQEDLLVLPRWLPWEIRHVYDGEAGGLDDWTDQVAWTHGLELLQIMARTSWLDNRPRPPQADLLDSPPLLPPGSTAGGPDSLPAHWIRRRERRWTGVSSW